MSDPIPSHPSRADGDTSIPQIDAVRLDARAASILRRRHGMSQTFGSSRIRVGKSLRIGLF